MEALAAEVAWLHKQRAEWALDREFNEMERAAYMETLAELEVSGVARREGAQERARLTCVVM